GTPVNEALIRDLAGGAFLAEQRNAVLVGGTGTGKSHLAMAIARACIRGGARGRPDAHRAINRGAVVAPSNPFRKPPAPTRQITPPAKLTPPTTRPPSRGVLHRSCSLHLVNKTG